VYLDIGIGHAEGAAATGIRTMRHQAGRLGVVGLECTKVLALLLHEYDHEYVTSSLRVGHQAPCGSVRQTT
jgi:hypothetical protein